LNAPVTRLDQRYSDPDAEAVSWEDTRRLLEAAEIVWLTTVRADGRPHVTPVVSVWTDGALYFSTGADEQKYLNLKANPYVVLVTGSSDWDSGIGVVVEGKAVHVTDEAVLSRAAEAFTVRWDGRWQYEVRDGRFYHGGGTGWPCEVFGISPAKAFAHAKGDPFGATTHRF
jgi:nitroimidazol reductase NimA-like FMN-containing flavoprotein (pyridoxamine 5'-phosphate oxidase superfamily)